MQRVENGTATNVYLRVSRFWKRNWETLTFKFSS